MTTKHPRLNVTLDSEGMKAISFLAKQGDTSLSAIARELIEEALELREDLYFSRIAAERDTPDAVWLSHEEVWKK